LSTGGRVRIVSRVVRFRSDGLSRQVVEHAGAMGPAIVGREIKHAKAVKTPCQIPLILVVMLIGDTLPRDRPRSASLPGAA